MSATSQQLCLLNAAGPPMATHQARGLLPQALISSLRPDFQHYHLLTVPSFDSSPQLSVYMCVYMHVYVHIYMHTHIYIDISSILLKPYAVALHKQKQTHAQRPFVFQRASGTGTSRVACKHCKLHRDGTSVSHALCNAERRIVDPVRKMFSQ